jgi:rhamnogalacturonyl hydrolase YesR
MHELLILAPSPESHRKFTFYIRCFVDAGVHFPFGEEDELPSDLPADLSGLRCIMIDPARRAEFAQTAALHAFERRGGYLYFPDLSLPMGGSLGDLEPRHRVQRAIVTAGLTTSHPRMIEVLQARDEAKLVEDWKRAAPDELGQYARMGGPFHDPPAYITFRAATEAAEYFEDETLAAPVWEFISQHAAAYGQSFDSCGGRYLLQLYEKSGDRRFLEPVINFFAQRKLWRLDGVYLNCDLKIPEGCDADDPPPLVRDDAWTWPETAANIGDTMAYLSKVTDDAQWADCAVTHVLNAHSWLFDEQINLWQHVGRPTGPDRRSAPWGRGNAWFLYAVRGLLDDLPETHEARPQLIEILSAGLEGLLSAQDEHGLWHNVLDAREGESRPCSSATSRFIHVYARAYWKDWLRDERIPIMLERAWNGLKTKVWESQLLAYCVGTSYALDRQVYLSRPHDSIRVSRSSLLLAWMEMQRMRQASA